MEKILKIANELGHLLQRNEVVKRFKELAAELEKDTDAREIMDGLITASQSFQEKEKNNLPIEVEEKKALAELQEKAQKNNLVTEFLATQAYYINILSQVNEAIAEPKGEPPKDSNIILPGSDDKSIIL